MHVGKGRRKYSVLVVCHVLKIGFESDSDSICVAKSHSSPMGRSNCL